MTRTRSAWTCVAFAAAVTACNGGDDVAADTGADAPAETAGDTRAFENCFNGLDDNDDALVDCADPQCRMLSTCRSHECPDGDLGSRVGFHAFAASTAGAGNDLSGSCGGQGGEDLALLWTAPRAGSYFIDTRWGSYDTVLYVLRGGCGGDEVACNDDAQSPLAFESEVRLDVEAGEQLLIVVDGYDQVVGADGGDFILNLTPELVPDETEYCDDRRDNDLDGRADCADEDCQGIPDCAPLDGVLAVYAGQQHACVTRGDGETLCWGAGSEGQLGTADPQNHGRPALSAFVGPALALGQNITCGLDGGGEVTCWGSGDSNFFGLGWGVDAADPVAIGVVAGAQSASISYNHGCALMDDATVRCWGANDWGQLATGNTAWLPAGTSAVVGEIASAQDVCAGSGFTCIVADAGAVWCAGNNNSGQLGVIPNGWGGGGERLGRVPGMEGAATVACGAQHVCATTATGAVWCWGANWSGQVGNGTTGQWSGPRAVDLDGTAVDLCAGGQHACAALDDGEVWCWGLGSSGQLGNGDLEQATRPVRARDLGGAIAVACGGEFTCALEAAGGVWCWGANGVGQLGDGTRDARPTPVPVLNARP